MSAMSAGWSFDSPSYAILSLTRRARIGLEQVDVGPRDHPRRDFLEERAKRERRHDALRQTADGAARADVHGDDRERDVAVDGRRIELDVVDADDFAAVDVDDLLVEEVALEKQHAVGGSRALPRGRIGFRADRGAALLDRRRREHTLAVSGFDDQVCDAGGVFLRSDGDFAHTSASRCRWHRGPLPRGVRTERRTEHN